MWPLQTYVSDHQIHVFADYVIVFQIGQEGEDFVVKKVEMSYLTYNPCLSHLKLLLIKLQMVGKPGGREEKIWQTWQKTGGWKASVYH